MRKLNSLLFNADQRSAKNGASSRRRKLFLASLAALCAAAWLLHAPEAIADPVRIVAFGDSLTAGLGLPAQDAFPSKLAVALKAKGYDVAIHQRRRLRRYDFGARAAVGRWPPVPKP